MNVSLSDAYAEACKALGESVVRERLLTREVDRLTAEVTERTAEIEQLTAPAK